VEIRDLEDRFVEFIEALGESRQWSVGRPLIVDGVDASDGDGSESVKTVGGLLEVHSALAGNPLPIEVDRRDFDDVRAVIEAVEKFSRDTLTDFEFELDGELIGAIDQGRLDRSLRVGLLEEWEKRIARGG